MTSSAPALRVFSWLVILLVAAVALVGTRPPAALGVNAAPEQFSAARAIMHLAVIAARPHPMGTQANQEVRDYLVATLTTLGGEVQIENTVGMQTRGRIVRAGNAQNIVARFPGSANRRAIMLMAHYDSVPEAPGAADDGAGLISILELLRALHAGSSIQNDLLVLFSDGEEPGLLGASGFVADHPDLAGRIGVVLNLEARGISGPAMMFETSAENGWLIPELARVAPHPMASSLMYAAYKLMPNDTDLSALRKTGIPALNFAFTETVEGYHSRLDTRENLSARSVQQMGTNALALVRRWGNLPLTNIRKPDDVYFNWLGHRLIVYPEWVVWPLALATFALLAVAWVTGRRRGVLQLSVAGVMGFFVVLLAIASGMLLLWMVINFLLGNSLLEGDAPSNRLLFAGLVAIGFSAGASALKVLSSRVGSRHLHAGMLVVAAFVATAVCFLLPGASYVFQWPVFFGTASLLVGMSGNSPKGYAISGFIAAIPAIMIISPLTYLFFANLDLNLTSLLAVSLLLSLLLAVAWPLYDFLMPRGFLMAFVIAGLGLIAAGASLSHPSAQHPRRDSLIYSVNADQGKAEWVSYDEAADRWTRHFLGLGPKPAPDPDFTAGSDRACLATEAPLVALEGPVATVISDRAEGDVRVLRLHLDPARDALSLLVRLPAKTDLASVAWGGRTQAVHAESAHPWSLRYEAVPPEGLDLELRVRGHGRVKLWLASSTPGLPESATVKYESRPVELMPAPGSDVTLVTRQYDF
ncbi:MAG: M28 family peptidase [Chthoniobacterales bacterium]